MRLPQASYPLRAAVAYGVWGDETGYKWYRGLMSPYRGHTGDTQRGAVGRWEALWRGHVRICGEQRLWHRLPRGSYELLTCSPHPLWVPACSWGDHNRDAVYIPDVAKIFSTHGTVMESMGHFIHTDIYDRSRTSPAIDTVYRGGYIRVADKFRPQLFAPLCTGEDIFRAVTQSWNIGDAITRNTVGSATTDPTIAHRFIPPSPILLHGATLAPVLYIYHGARGVSMNAYSDLHVPEINRIVDCVSFEEDEYMLPPQQTGRIDHMTLHDNITMIHMTV